MAIEDAADRAAFLADWGVAITWTRAAVAQPTFLAIFDRPAIVLDDGDQSMIDRDAWLSCPEAYLPTGAAENDPVAVAGESVTFLCKAIRPDGTGWAIVDLRRA